MANTINYILNEIRQSIPYEILYAGFTIDDTPETININSLDDKILRKLLKKRVFLDLNVIGGIEMLIPINNLNPSFTEYGYTVYNIPNELTGNKEIISVLGLNSLNILGVPGSTGLASGYYSTTAGGMVGNSLTNVAHRIGNSVAPETYVTNAHTEIVGYNTILIYANFRLLYNYALRVLLENDSNLNNIQPRSYKNISTLCILAAKAYIYNKLIIPLNNGYLASGQELGIIKNIIESYEDANEQYNTYLREVVGSILFMNDTTRYNRYLNSMIAPDI